MSLPDKLEKYEFTFDGKQAFIAYLYDRYRLKYLRFSTQDLSNYLYILQEVYGLPLCYDFQPHRELGTESFVFDQELKLLNIRGFFTYANSRNDEVKIINKGKMYGSYRECYAKSCNAELLEELLKKFDEEYAGETTNSLSKKVFVISTIKDYQLTMVEELGDKVEDVLPILLMRGNDKVAPENEIRLTKEEEEEILEVFKHVVKNEIV